MTQDVASGEPSLPQPETVEGLPTLPGYVAEPWLRLFARTIDNCVWVAVLGAFLVVPAFVIEPNRPPLSPLVSRFIDWLLLPLALVLDALCYTLCGNTPGKAIAGIKVRTLQGKKVGLTTYLKRNFSMYFYGMGLGIPVVNLVTAYESYQRAEGGQSTRWDEALDTRPMVASHSTVRLVITAAIWIVLAVVQFVVLSL